MSRFEQDANHPGRQLLILGLVAYVLMALIGLAFLPNRPDIAKHVLAVLWWTTAVPLGLPLVAMIIVYGQAELYCIPTFGLDHALSAAARHWRLVLGVTLSLSAIGAALTMIGIAFA